MSYRVNTLRPGAQPGDAGAGDESARAAARAAAERATERPAPSRAKGSPYREQTDWGQVAAFAAGVAVGALLGAGAALLNAPQTGVETRLALKRRARTARVQAADRWDDLGRELRSATRRGKRKVRRGIAESRWRAADAFEG